MNTTNVIFTRTSGNIWYTIISATLNLILRRYEYYILLKVLFNTDLVLFSCIVCIVNNVTKYDE